MFLQDFVNKLAKFGEVLGSGRVSVVVPIRIGSEHMIVIWGTLVPSGMSYVFQRKLLQEFLDLAELGFLVMMKTPSCGLEVSNLVLAEVGLKAEISLTTL